MSPKVFNPPITEPTDIEMDKMPDKELQKLIIKMINEKGNLKNEQKKEIQDIKEHFHKETETVKKNQT